MLKRLTSLILIAGLACTTSCSIKHTFSPALVTENDMMRITVTQMRLKKDILLLKTEFHNKTDAKLMVTPTASLAKSGGVETSGSRKVAVYRNDRSFSVIPKAHKKVNMEYRGITPTDDVTVLFAGITQDGTAGSFDLELVVPYVWGDRPTKKIDEDMKEKMETEHSEGSEEKPEAKK